MAELIPFRPTPQGPFTFQAVLDGISYLGIVKWNVFGQRWYLFLYDQSSTRALTIAMVASPEPLPIAAAAWDNGIVTLTAKEPHGLQVGKTLSFTISGMLPAEYNGQKVCLVTGPSTLTYGLSANPGMAAAVGTFGYDISLTKGYFATQIVYRERTQNIEII